MGSPNEQAAAPGRHPRVSSRRAPLARGHASARARDTGDGGRRRRRVGAVLGRVAKDSFEARRKTRVGRLRQGPTLNRTPCRPDSRRSPCPTSAHMSKRDIASSRGTLQRGHPLSRPATDRVASCAVRDSVARDHAEDQPAGQRGTGGRAGGRTEEDLRAAAGCRSPTGSSDRAEVGRAAAVSNACGSGGDHRRDRAPRRVVRRVGKRAREAGRWGLDRRSGQLTRGAFASRGPPSGRSRPCTPSTPRPGAAAERGAVGRLAGGRRATSEAPR